MRARTPPTPTGSRAGSVPMDGPLGSDFGPRWGGTHEGIDIEGWYETRVRATQRGRVTHVGWLDDYSGYGLVIRFGTTEGS